MQTLFRYIIPISDVAVFQQFFVFIDQLDKDTCKTVPLSNDVIMQIIEDDRKQQEAGKAIRHSPSA